jgi:hypothetical protein
MENFFKKLCYFAMYFMYPAHLICTSYEAHHAIFNSKMHCDVVLLKYGHQLLNDLYVFY